MPRVRPFLTPALLVLLEILHFIIRWALLNSPFFSEVDYDQAIPGLMSLHILRGDPQLMLWGQPRMGGLEAYLASFLFYLVRPSTVSLHLSLIAVSSVILLIIYELGKKVGGEWVGIMAASYWAVPPIFLTFNGNYVGGGHLESILLGSLLLWGTCLLPSLPPSKKILLSGLLGLLAGLGGWSSLLIIPFILAAFLGLIGTRPRLFWSPLPWIGLAGFLLGSLPFWAWNYYHNFDTLIHLGERDFFSAARYLTAVFTSIIPTLTGTFWGSQSVSAQIPKFLELGILFGFLFPVLIIALAVPFLWAKRMVTKRPPFQKPLDYIVLILWSFILVRIAGTAEDLGLTRYIMALFVPLSILFSFWLAIVFRFGKVIGTFFMACLLGFNLLTNVLYLIQNKDNPVRPVDDLIKTLQHSDIRYCYGHNRITQVVTFESQERIIAADFFGTRNYDYLKTVDRAPAQETAILTHRKLGNPFPETMENSLQLLGATFEKKEIGDYVFFYHFKEPIGSLKSIPAGEWEMTASQEKVQLPLLKDRDLLTAWRIPNKSGDWLQIDLGRERRLGRISLLPGAVEFGVPSHFKVEISRDEKSWKTLRDIKDYLPGLYWSQGRPRLDQLPLIQIFFPPQNGRYLRITNLSENGNSQNLWTVAELFVYEAGEAPQPFLEKANAYLNLAQSHLDNWMKDPTGPHPLVPRLSMNFRKNQVDWGGVVESLNLTIREAPDWEEPYLLFGRAVLLGELWTNQQVAKAKNQNDSLALFPKDGLTVIPSQAFRVISSHNSQEARLAIDGNPLTRWTSGKGQEPGMFFQVDLGDKYLVNGFSLFFEGSLNDYPRSLKVLVSSDGKDWPALDVSPHSDYAFDQGRLIKKTVYRIIPAEFRFLRLLEIDHDPEFWWSIHELEVYGGKRIPGWN